MHLHALTYPIISLDVVRIFTGLDLMRLPLLISNNVFRFVAPFAMQPKNTS